MRFHQFDCIASKKLGTKMELVKQKFPVIVVFPPHETDLATYVQAQLLEDMEVLLYLLGRLTTHGSHISPLLT